ncbi:MAG: sigma-54-dependent Fis family transcriptional regulator [Pirellulales bacterium]|nr:sigma-54-dependent Fis family transcriptional regulator [Pirellulales bacterium]
MSQGVLLLVDDDRHVLESMAEWLRDQGYELDAIDSYHAAIAQIKAKAYDLILIDIRLSDGDGMELLSVCRETCPEAAVIMITGYGTVDTAVDAIREGAFDFLTKPLIDDELLLAIERALAQKNVLRENNHLRAQLDLRFGIDNIIGHDMKMRQIFDMIESIADTRATVLITGESGTGKSLVARAIHRRSHRSDGPFVEVACGALPENLLESELFGHVAGAFTGATGNKIGKFKLADCGTIFLDEIGTASPAMQVKLLRVLQELQFEPVGGNQTENIDVRILLATNEDLSKAVADGRFRQDLFYRINVINIGLPPLRERLADIPLLAQSFLEKVAEDSHRQVEGLTDEAIAALHRYRWPGNVRELQNVIERAVLLGKGQIIGLDDLPPEIGGVIGGVVHHSNKMTLKQALEGPERQIILDVLESNQWNRNATADALGINRTTLYKKMKRLGLEDLEHALQ